MHQNMPLNKFYLRNKKEKWKPIIFLLWTIQTAKKNYKIYYKKLLAIVEALAK